MAIGHESWHFRRSRVSKVMGKKEKEQASRNQIAPKLWNRLWILIHLGSNNTVPYPNVKATVYKSRFPPLTALFTKPRVSRSTFLFASNRMRNTWSPGMRNHSATITIPIPCLLCTKKPWTFMPLFGAWRPMAFYCTLTLLAVFHMLYILVTIMASSVEKLDYISQSYLDYSLIQAMKPSWPVFDTMEQFKPCYLRYSYIDLGYRKTLQRERLLKDRNDPFYQLTVDEVKRK